MDNFISLGDDTPPKKVKNSNNKKVKNGNKNLNKTKGGKVKKVNNPKKLKKISKDDSEPKYKYMMKLLFGQPCPEPSVVRELHPLIEHVIKHPRPPSIRYCLLTFKSAEDLAQVHSALHKKHIEPYKGVLKCLKTQTEIMKEIRASSPELLDKEYLTRVDIKHAKYVHNKDLGATYDVRCNSTARELFVRYGVGVPLISLSEEHDDADVPTAC